MDGHRLFRILSVAAFLATYVTMLLGGNVMASDSGLACPDWPTCHGSLLAPLTGPIGIEWSHRIAALVLSLTILGLGIAALAFESRRPVLRNLALASVAVVLAQALLGGLVVTSALDLGVVLAHFGLATVLFGLTLLLAVLANLRTLPPAWLEWARRASDDRPIDPSPAVRPLPSPSDRAPAFSRASSPVGEP